MLLGKSKLQKSTTHNDYYVKAELTPDEHNSEKRSLYVRYQLITNHGFERSQLKIKNTKLQFDSNELDTTPNIDDIARELRQKASNEISNVEPAAQI